MSQLSSSGSAGISASSLRTSGNFSPAEFRKHWSPQDVAGTSKLGIKPKYQEIMATWEEHKAMFASSDMIQHVLLTKFTNPAQRVGLIKMCKRLAQFSLFKLSDLIPLNERQWAHLALPVGVTNFLKEIITQRTEERLCAAARALPDLDPVFAKHGLPLVDDLEPFLAVLDVDPDHVDLTIIATKMEDVDGKLAAIKTAFFNAAKALRDEADMEGNFIVDPTDKLNETAVLHAKREAAMYHHARVKKDKARIDTVMREIGLFKRSFAAVTDKISSSDARLDMLVAGDTVVACMPNLADELPESWRAVQDASLPLVKWAILSDWALSIHQMWESAVMYKRSVVEDATEKSKLSQGLREGRHLLLKKMRLIGADINTYDVVRLKLRAAFRPAGPIELILLFADYYKNLSGEADEHAVNWVHMVDALSIVKRIVQCDQRFRVPAGVALSKLFAEVVAFLARKQAHDGLEEIVPETVSTEFEEKVKTAAKAKGDVPLTADEIKQIAADLNTKIGVGKKKKSKKEKAKVEVSPEMLKVARQDDDMQKLSACIKVVNEMCPLIGGPYPFFLRVMKTVYHGTNSGAPRSLEFALALLYNAMRISLVDLPAVGKFFDLLKSNLTEDDLSGVKAQEDENADAEAVKKGRKEWLKHKIQKFKAKRAKKKKDKKGVKEQEAEVARDEERMGMAAILDFGFNEVLFETQCLLFCTTFKRIKPTLGDEKNKQIFKGRLMQVWNEIGSMIDSTSQAVDEKKAKGKKKITKVQCHILQRTMGLVHLMAFVPDEDAESDGSLAAFKEAVTDVASTPAAKAIVDELKSARASNGKTIADLLAMVDLGPEEYEGPSRERPQEVQEAQLQEDLKRYFARKDELEASASEENVRKKKGKKAKTSGPQETNTRDINWSTLPQHVKEYMKFEFTLEFARVCGTVFSVISTVQWRNVIPSNEALTTLGITNLISGVLLVFVCLKFKADMKKLKGRERAYEAAGIAYADKSYDRAMMWLDFGTGFALQGTLFSFGVIWFIQILGAAVPWTAFWGFAVVGVFGAFLSGIFFCVKGLMLLFAAYMNWQASNDLLTFHGQMRMLLTVTDQGLPITDDDDITYCIQWSRHLSSWLDDLAYEIKESKKTQASVVLAGTSLVLVGVSALLATFGVALTAGLFGIVGGIIGIWAAYMFWKQSSKKVFKRIEMGGSLTYAIGGVRAAHAAYGDYVGGAFTGEAWADVADHHKATVSMCAGVTVAICERLTTINPTTHLAPTAAQINDIVDISLDRAFFSGL
eukprot:CAMPEP_0177651748 /NCGR_PEP_ID=MMETSP0447-20121125/12726_1 /TAXON_ID=0 /ORGANISM="Stygamoeba regulata, Strain BSH-02190019" /LENGTH=1268 /DNA_ID=CAMNT_0019154875 /DNA_START=37 /DNA_END=3843 /DNA_ORIENTATION=+